MSSLILLSPSEARALKPSRHLAPARGKAIAAGPFSVTFHRPGPATEAGPNDYFSEGPYWWPNPLFPDGPYIRSDGNTNPHRFTHHHDDLGRLSEAVLTLALAAFLVKDAEAAARAWQLARVWFMDPATRMTPHLEYGQAIRGRTSGRGIGIIDTRPFIWLVQGLSLLRVSHPNPAVDTAVVDWFRTYTQWLRWSGKGRDELYHGNNHSTWWVAQVAAYGLYADIPGALTQCWETYRGFLVPHQLQPGGSQPLEEARTRSLSYSSMNLDGFALICRMAKRQGVDLWSYQTESGAGVLRTLEYLVPFLWEPEKWTKPQITRVTGSRGYAAALAARDVPGREAWLALHRKYGGPANAFGLLLSSLPG
jgi:hypothetical protein